MVKEVLIMDFPVRLLCFRLVNYKEHENKATYVRYLLKMKEKTVFTSVEQMGSGYLHQVQSFTNSNKDTFSKYYPSEEQAFDAMVSWMIGYKVCE